MYDNFCNLLFTFANSLDADQAKCGAWSESKLFVNVQFKKKTSDDKKAN